MISIRTPRNFARCFSLAIVLLVWQGAVFAIDRLPDRRTSKSATSKSAVSKSSSGQLSAASESLVDLLGQVDSLQNELQELRNQSEVQAYEIERLKKQQKDVLQDLDQRLGRLERGEKSLGRAGISGAAGAISLIEKPPVKTGTGSAATSGVKSGSKAGATGKTGKRPVTKPLGTKSKPASQAKKEYDAAFALLKQGLYEKASRSFRSFVKRNPNHKLAGNAQYWIGEANYVMRNFKVALKEFKKVPAKYPKSNKVADAQLKIGYVYFELEDWNKASKTLKNVIKSYPNTRVSKYAENRLAKIKKRKKKKK